MSAFRPFVGTLNSRKDVISRHIFKKMTLADLSLTGLKGLAGYYKYWQQAMY